MATNQEILESYKQGIGAGEGQVNTQMLIQALRDRQRRAEASDAATAKNLQSIGKAGLNLIKARRDFLLAKRGNPNLKFTEFMADPKTSAKYMERGTSSIVGGESPKIGLKETFNPFSRDYARNLNVEATQSSPEYQALRRDANQAIPSAQPEMLPDFELDKSYPNTIDANPTIPLTEFEDYSNLPKPPPRAPMGDITGEGFNLPRSVENFSQQALGGNMSPSTLSNFPLTPQAPTPPFSPPAPMGPVTEQGLQQALGRSVAQPSLVDMSRGAGVNLPIKLPPVNVIGKAPVSSSAPLRKAIGMDLQNIKPVSVPDPTAGASAVGEKTGAFGNVLGAVGTGKNILDVFNAKTDEDRKQSMVNAAISGAGLINPVLGAGLGLMNMLRNRR